jgi:hypothetical protein
MAPTTRKHLLPKALPIEIQRMDRAAKKQPAGASFRRHYPYSFCGLRFRARTSRLGTGECSNAKDKEADEDVSLRRGGAE